ncbi:MAG: hypothetical protein KTR31_12400 [Myxococcales bacterium]|nr:hypothetical protein [Myxococcales bacterium]
MTWLLWAGCSWGPTEEPPAPAPPPGHVAGWDALVRSVARGDVDTSQVHARDLTLGSVDDTHDSATSLGAALGFLQVAGDGEDLAMGLVQALQACGACHAARGVQPLSDPPAATHHATAAERAAWGVVFSVDLPLAVTEVPDGLRDAWDAPEGPQPKARAQGMGRATEPRGIPDRMPSVLGSCHRCHVDEAATGAPSTE